MDLNNRVVPPKSTRNPSQTSYDKRFNFDHSVSHSELNNMGAGKNFGHAKKQSETFESDSYQVQYGFKNPTHE